QGHGRIQIVKDAKAGPGRENQFRGRNPVGAEGGHDRDVGIRQMAIGWLAGVAPVRVEMEFSIRELRQVAVQGVVGNVALEEHGSMAAPAEGGAQAAPERCMPVSPGGADRKAENYQFHAAVCYAPPCPAVPPGPYGPGRLSHSTEYGAEGSGPPARVR